MSNLRNLKRRGLSALKAFGLAWIFFGFLGGCGARLPRDITIKRPVANEVATRIDLNAVQFTDITSGQPVNAGQWMDEQKTGFMLLTFGSRACSACNKKARQIRDNYISADQLALKGDGPKLAIVGVNTDNGSLSLTQRFVQSEGFNFIRWSDPKGDQMLRWFMPGGRSYGVPLTVMLSREGILWSYTNDSSVTVDEIMERARGTMGDDALPDPDDDGGDDGGDDHGDDNPRPVDLPPLLALEGSGRMAGVQVAACGLTPDKFWAQPVSLAEVLPLNRLATFFHVEITSCGEVCRLNRALLQRKVESVLTGDIAAGFLYAGQGLGGCEKFLPGAGESSAAVIPRVQAFAGGTEFFDVFATHFDWNHPVVELAGGSLVVEPLAPAITLAFDRDGKLLFSAEGALDEARLDSFLRSLWLPRSVKGPPPFANGPAWNFHGMPAGHGQGELIDFSTWRHAAKYSVVNAFGETCGSCMAELKHWSRPGGLFEMCNKNPDFCIVAAAENGLPESAYVNPGPVDSKEMDSYLARITAGLVSLGIAAPLVMLDPYSPENDGGSGYLRRFFDGYLIAKFPEFGFDFRTIVSDREGKILGVFRAVPPSGASNGNSQLSGGGDHVEDFLMRLRNLSADDGLKGEIQ